MFEKALEFAESGRGRRLLNILKKKEHSLSHSQMEKILTAYKNTGLEIEVESLKKRRGIIECTKYDDLADKVNECCTIESIDEFMTCLKDLLSSGIKMNPAKMEYDN